MRNISPNYPDNTKEESGNNQAATEQWTSGKKSTVSTITNQTDAVSG